MPPGQAPFEEGPRKLNTQIIPVTGTVWCFRRPSYFACSYLISVEDGFVAIDFGMDSYARDFLAELDALGIAPHRVRAILLTHRHNDHSAGAAFLQREFGVRVYYAAADQPWFTRETAAKGL